MGRQTRSVKATRAFWTRGKGFVILFDCNGKKFQKRFDEQFVTDKGEVNLPALRNWLEHGTLLVALPATQNEIVKQVAGLLKR